MLYLILFLLIDAIITATAIIYLDNRETKKVVNNNAHILADLCNAHAMLSNHAYKVSSEIIELRENTIIKKEYLQ